MNPTEDVNILDGSILTITIRKGARKRRLRDQNKGSILDKMDIEVGAKVLTTYGPGWVTDIVEDMSRATLGGSSSESCPTIKVHFGDPSITYRIDHPDYWSFNLFIPSQLIVCVTDSQMPMQTLKPIHEMARLLTHQHSNPLKITVKVDCQSVHFLNTHAGTGFQAHRPNNAGEAQ